MEWRQERGIAAILVIYGLSVFSVLALTMITDAGLERKFRLEDPDLHLVLFGGRADSDHLVGRLNIPTVLRTSAETDFGIEVKLPVPIGADLQQEFTPGSTYSVRLSADVQVCCDTGDGACASLPPDAALPPGSVNRTVPSIRTNAKTDLRFDLSTFPPGEGLALDPALATESPFLVKAVRDRSTDPAAPLADANLMCRVEKSGAEIAGGSLSVKVSAPGRTTGPFTGIIQLRYAAAKTER